MITAVFRFFEKNDTYVSYYQSVNAVKAVQSFANDNPDVDLQSVSFMHFTPSGIELKKKYRSW